MSDRIGRPAKFIGGHLNGQWRNIAGARRHLFQAGPDLVETYERSCTIWHDEEHEVLSHFVYTLVESNPGRLR